MNNNIKIFSTVVFVVLLLLASYFFITKDAEKGIGTRVNSIATSSEQSVGKLPEVPEKGGVQALTYPDALKKYANRRLQITPTCQITPNTVTYKNGTTIMIDNRSDKVKLIKIGSTVSVPAYGFKIITLSSGTLPAKYFVDCDKQQNVATVILQK